MSADLSTLPEKFVDTVRATFGAAGDVFLRDLPRIVADSKARWDIELFAPYSNLSFNYVVPGKLMDGTEVVLKIGVPENKELLTEIAALRFYDGQGMVRLIESAPENGVLLLERVLPGAPLKTEPDDSVATRIAAEMMRKLCQPAPQQHSFPSTAKWFEGFKRLRNRFNGGSGPLPEKLVSLAEDLSTQLLASAPDSVVLHGDLHHDNILSSGRHWLAIDPKGVVGEPCYEVGAFMRNPIELYDNLSQATIAVKRRFRIFNEVLGFDRDRMSAWSFSQAVLSAFWCLEDNDSGWEASLVCAETLARFV